MKRRVVMDISEITTDGIHLTEQGTKISGRQIV